MKLLLKKASHFRLAFFLFACQTELETKFGSELSNARSADCVGYHAEINAVLQIAVRIGEVHGVE